MFDSSSKVIWISKTAYYCALLAFASSIFFILSSPQDDSGLYGYVAFGLFVAAFVLSFVSLGAMLITRNFSGITKSLLAIILSALPLFIIVQVELTARARQKVVLVHSGLKTLEALDNTLRNYERTNGHLPDADRWCDSLLEYDSSLSKESFIHPGAKVLKLKGECHFAFNKNLSGVKLSDAGPEAILLFWADGSWNLNGEAELLEPEIGKYGYIFITLANGKTATYHYNSKSYTIHNKNYESKDLNWK